MTHPRIGLVVVAAGSGTRLGRAEPKAFVDLRGRPILQHALEGALAADGPMSVVVVAPAAELDAARGIVERVGAAGDARVVAGGATRQGSVAAGLAALPVEVEVVLVHDAARALTPPALFGRVARAVDETGAGVIPGVPVADTLKRLDASGAVLGTVDRSELAAVQTPQGFPRALLDAAYAAATDDHTDDAALVAAAGHPVVVVEGEARAFKITTAWDLRRAENELAPAAGLRTGIGVDVHAYDPDAELWLGGLHWPDEAGLSGHSDGDAVVHAVCDALLSAAGLGDIGGRFGTDDPRFRDARSEVFLRETLQLLADAGFAVVNVAVQVVARRPRLAPRRTEMESRLSALVGAPVSLGATTTDGLGFTGRGEGVQAIATALIAVAS